MALIDAALQYVARGWFVLPLTWPIFPSNAEGVAGRCSCGNPKCSSPGKHPLIAKGANAASCDSSQVEAWWARWPEANIGIATGPSGLVVLDVDGAAGREQLQREIGVLPETLVASTGRKDGFHLYYKGAIPSSQVKGEHLDVRGTSGYVVAPPSKHISSKYYKWHEFGAEKLLIGTAPVPKSLTDWNNRRKRGGLSRQRASAAIPPTTEKTFTLTLPGEASEPAGRTSVVSPGTTARENESTGAIERAAKLESSRGSERAEAKDSTKQEERARLSDSAKPNARAGRVESTVGPERIRAGEALHKATLPPYSPYERNKLCSALAAIPADIDGKTWASYGVALFDLEWTEYGQNGTATDVGFEIWDAWSKTSKGEGPGKGEYRGRDDLEKRWKRFTHNFQGVPVTIASIYEHAKSVGWNWSGGYQEINSDNFNGVESAVGFLGQNINVNAIKFEDFGAKGQILGTATNTRIAVRALGIHCEYDLFHNRQYINGQVIKQWKGEIADDIALAIRSQIRERWKLDPSTQTTFDALTMECIQHAYDPVMDYLDSLQWDGTKRLQTWTSAFLGAEDTPFNQIAGALALVASVRRVRMPGCKFDHVIVLEGAEGIGKSSAIAVLAGQDNFSDQEILTLDERRQQEAVQGVWLYELAELAGMRRADIERVKSFVTRTCDRTRPAYGRKRIDRPRRCTFWATCNDGHYLLSQTGNRRWWPIHCGKVKLEELIARRDQLWAEACTIEAKAVALSLPEAFWQEAALIQDSRRVIDPWEDILANIESKVSVQTALNSAGQMEHRIATEDLMTVFLGIDKQHQTTIQLQRLSRIMRNLGWQSSHHVRIKFAGVESQRRGFTKLK